MQRREWQRSRPPLQSAPLTERAERAIPWAWATGLFAALFALALARHHTVLSSYDLAYFTQAGWLINEGREPFVTVRGLHLLADHGSFAFYPMAVLGRGVVGLLALQSLFLAAGVVPLWHIARRLAGLSVGVSCALLGAYSLYPAMSNVGLFDFHPESLVVPALLAAAYFGLRGGRWVPYAVCVAAVLLCREDVAVTVTFLGVLLVLEGRRRAGVLTSVAAVVWLVLDLAVVLPHYAGGSYVQANRFSQYGDGDSLGSAVAYMATHPWDVAVDFASKPNAYVLLGLFLPVLFLPLLSPKHLLPGLPLQLAYLLTNVAAAHTITAQYTVTTIPFVFLATAFALRRFRGRPLHRGLVAVAVAGFLVFATASPRNAPWEWFWRDRVDRARLDAARLVPRRAAVSASTRMWPLLAERRALYNWPNPIQFYEPHRDPVPVERRLAELKWVVVDTADDEQWRFEHERARGAFLAPGNTLGFVKVFDEAGIQVYRRP